MPLLEGAAIVTGAAQGIGRAIALRLADDGHNVALVDLNSKSSKLVELQAEITSKNRKACVLTADVSSDLEVKQMVANAVQALGPIAVMVANAGICQTASIQTTTTAFWDKMFAVNVRGTFLCFKYAAEQMILQGHGGRLIAASSIGGKQGTIDGSAYCASKFAVRGLTQSLSVELRSHKITVNAYAPGAIRTEMLTGLGVDPEATTLPSGLEIGVPEDIAGMVSYIASTESRFMTGQTVSINGGSYFD
jgi:NAD(P)-dependent dehydrogenase (short-subunit alcohol dehydrogenase family)